MKNGLESTKPFKLTHENLISWFQKMLNFWILKCYLVAIYQTQSVLESSLLRCVHCILLDTVILRSQKTDCQYIRIVTIQFCAECAF